MLDFNPMLTPIEMLKEGVFGGSYFGVEDLKGDCDYQILFKEALADVPTNLYLGDKYRPKNNKFKVRSGMPYEYWKEMNWFHEDDPYGWYEWYIKYYNGRRHSDDNRQIRRWQEFCGKRGRWRNRIYKMIDENNNWNISPRIQQSLLHWGYKVNKEDFEYYLINKK